MSLADGKCEPCRGGVPPLGAEAAKRMVAEVPEWSLNDAGDRISRTFKLKNFREALAFVNKVGELAEAEGHHPDIAIHWNKVDLVLWTHKIGGLHRNDFVLAAKIDRLA